MRASRELDVKVAKRLGWTKIHFDDKPDFDGDTRKPSMEWFGIRPGEDFYRELPYFKEGIAAAWELVEQSNGWVYMTCDKGQRQWKVQFMGMREWGIADSAPLAICLAFLKATEG